MYPVIDITVRFLKNMLMAAWLRSCDHYSKRSRGNGCIHTCLHLSPKALLKQVKTNKTINKDAIRPLRRHEQRDQLNHLWHYSLPSTWTALEAGSMKAQSTGPKKAKWAIITLTQTACNCGEMAPSPCDAWFSRSSCTFAVICCERFH